MKLIENRCSRYGTLIVVTVCAAATLIGCKPTSQPVPSQAATAAAVDRLGAFKLGMSFEDVLATMDPRDLEPIGLRECLNDLPLRGCGLSSNTERAAPERHDGIPYGRTFEFNRHDKLVGIGLHYDRENDITRRQCFDIFGRTLDWVNSDLGSFVARGDLDHAKVPVTSATTARGARYRMSVDADGSGQADMFFLPAAPAPAPNGHYTFTKRTASLLGIYLSTRTGECMVDLNISEPDSVERRISAGGERRHRAAWRSTAGANDELL